MIFIGLMAVIAPLAEPFGGQLPRFLCYLILTLLSSGLKVRLPGVTGTMSISFLFILLGLVELSLFQAMLVGLGSALVQIFWQAKKRPGFTQIAFNLAVIAVAIRVGGAAFDSPLTVVLGGSLPVRLLLATVGYFVTNTLMVSGAIALTERRSIADVWRECYFWALPYNLLGATIVCIIHWRASSKLENR